MKCHCSWYPVLQWLWWVVISETSSLLFSSCFNYMGTLTACAVNIANSTLLGAELLPVLVQHNKGGLSTLLTTHPQSGLCKTLNFWWFTSMLRIIQKWIIQMIQIWMISSTFQFYIGNNRHISSQFGWYNWQIIHIWMICVDHKSSINA